MDPLFEVIAIAAEVAPQRFHQPELLRDGQFKVAQPNARWAPIMV